jgi:maintenance of morphology protein 1
VILIGAFIKFFIFGDISNEDANASTLSQKRTLAHKSSLFSLEQRQRSLRRKRSSILRNLPPLTTATILSKTYYNVNSHQPESLDWFNVLVAQTIAQFRSDAQHDDAILRSLSSVLNGPQIPDFLDEIKITEVSLGEEFPIFSNCRVIPVNEDGISGGAGTAVGEGGRLQARMDVDLSDFITLGVETKLILNYPKPRVAVLPVALSVSVVRFSGTVNSRFLLPLSKSARGVKANVPPLSSSPYRSFPPHPQLPLPQPSRSPSSTTTASTSQSAPSSDPVPAFRTSRRSLSSSSSGFTPGLTSGAWSRDSSRL